MDWVAYALSPSHYQVKIWIKHSKLWFGERERRRKRGGICRKKAEGKGKIKKKNGPE